MNIYILGFRVNPLKNILTITTVLFFYLYLLLFLQLVTLFIVLIGYLFMNMTLF